MRTTANDASETRKKTPTLGESLNSSGSFSMAFAGRMMTKSRKQPHQFSVGGVYTCAPTQVKATNTAIIARDQSYDQPSSRGVRSLDTSKPRPLHVSGLTPGQQAILELVRRSLANRRGCS